MAPTPSSSLLSSAIPQPDSPASSPPISHRRFFPSTNSPRPPQIITSLTTPPSSPTDHSLGALPFPRLPSDSHSAFRLSVQPSSSTPDLRRYSAPPRHPFSITVPSQADETASLLTQPGLGVPPHEPHNRRYDHQLLGVTPINHHNSDRNFQPRPSSSAISSRPHSSTSVHHTPLFHLSSTQTEAQLNSHSANSSNQYHQQHGPTPIGSTAALAFAAATAGGVPMTINRPASIAPSIGPPAERPITFKDVSVLYQVVAERRTAFDNLLWQVPATSLTAHAFLFSISLAADTGRFARIASMSLCIVITILTLHLFTRQLQAEDADHRWLADFEERHQIDYFDRAHGARWKDYRAQRPPGAGRLGWLAMHRSYPLWSKGMIAIGALAFAILILAIFHEAALVGYNCQLN